jgi:hypothetical protein
MDTVEAIRLALIELGEAGDDQLAAFAWDHYGVLIDPQYVPIVRAILRHRERKAQRRDRPAAGGAGASPTAAAG